ncbi:helix-turn-helix domain-containing protein [uncultured Roseovarius sp.]|uniref:helix-turn-helix domain-containing protein n=1 Tax=uncultured Roseovarius sp. TaxID=293344 RepID=UPI00262AAFF9|nr:helix-turn-helix domain-containing protein [uncultured Roseovarius sp.]
MFTQPESKQTFITGPQKGRSPAACWSRALSNCFFPIEASNFTAKSRFQGSVTVRSVGDINVSRMQSDGHHLNRTKSGIAKSSQESLLFIIPTQGHFSFEHMGREGLVRHGDALLLKTSEPYHTVCSDKYANVLFEVAVPKLEHRIASVEDACGRTMTLDSASRWFFKQTLSSMLDLENDDETDQNAISNELSNYIVSLAVKNIGLHLLGGQGNASSTYREGARQRVATYILDNLSDADLTPQKIADHHGVSVSYLHKLFHGSGTTVTQLIIEKRLSMCLEMLRNPACNGLSVTEIAFQAGFSNSAHFSTRFRKQYGFPPRQARASQDC